MFLGEIIKQYRTEHELSQRDFAKQCKLSHTYIAALEKNIDSRTGKPIAPTLDSVKNISKAMNIDIDTLLHILDDEQEFTINEINTKQAIPLLGTVKAGYDYIANENIIGYISVNEKITDFENCFALKVTGDSMQPVLYEDDTIIIHKQNDVESGQIAIILIDNEEATVKKVIKHENHIELIAFNSYYPPRNLDKNTKFTILGKVIEGRIKKVFE